MLHWSQHLRAPLFGALMLAAALPALPAGAQGGPALSVTPSTVRPGQTIQVTAAGFTAPNQVGIPFCVGVLGPGNNVERNVSPQFRERVGLVDIDSAGKGKATLTAPANLVPGVYQLVAGGCPSQPDLAPLATLASATLTVVTPAGTSGAGTVAQVPQLPRAMPSTGGGGMAR